MGGVRANFLYRNLANATSLLGVLPLVVLFLDDGYRFVIALLLFNNCLDALEGVLAARLNIKTRFGADLDNVCDAVAHAILTLAVGAHFGGLVMVASAIAAGAILLRVVGRLDPRAIEGIGSQPNELMRRLLFTLQLAGQFDFSPAYILIAVYLVHAVSMLVPHPMPHPIIDRAKSAKALGLVNGALVIAWLVPVTTPVITATFVAAYIYSFIVGSIGWWNKLAVKTLL